LSRNEAGLAQPLSLVGLPGCGKSSVARLVARHYGYVCVDTDSVIEARVGMPIKDYFSAYGEASFRDVETQVLRDCLKTSVPTVLATGGGIVLRPENRELLQKQSLVFFLRSTPEELVRRLKGDTKRPLLQGGDALRKLRELQAVREPLYRQTAHYVVDAGRPSVWALVHWICMQLDLGGHGMPKSVLPA
jgi:shikimate kinase